MATEDMVELLLANRAEVNARGWANKTPYGVAEDNHHKGVVELLRQHDGHE
jgi:hypothetical protein